VEQSGIIICAHCDCMAGLGEACSHISAILFTLDANTQARKSLSCTSLPCSWLPPTLKNVPFAQIADIDFSVPDQRKKRRVWPEKRINDTPITSKKRSITPSSLELDNFYKKLSESGKSVLLSLVPTYSKAYVPLYELGVLPKPSQIFLRKNIILSWAFITVWIMLWWINNHSKTVRSCWKENQAADWLRVWFQQRAGQITASRIRAAIHTDPTQPSPSLIKSKCYPESHPFKTWATTWGCEHEQTVRDAYVAMAEKTHTGL